MLDTIREYGAFWLHELGEERTVRRRHRDHYLSLARAADAAWIGPGRAALYDGMTAEHANLRAALDFCLAEGDGGTALEMGGVLWFFWLACGFARDGRHYLDRALALDPTPGPTRAKALWACGIAAIAQGDTETSGRFATAFRAAVADDTDRTALDGKRRLRDSLGIAMAVDLLASVAAAARNAAQAARFLGVAERIWRTLGTPRTGMPEPVAARRACEAEARRLIGDDAYEAAFHGGCHTDPDTGIAEALRPPAPSHHAPAQPGSTGRPGRNPR
ncbi:hypothetical protein GCM10010129_15630 [Streptomyces fumigatiscleroticus]|nr:hypothetical protein GCM10010129_15630 [Streptomyces fumigatiscleroticus]